MDHCVKKCDHGKFAGMIQCRDVCIGNLGGYFLWKDKQATNLSEQFAERNYCKKTCLEKLGRGNCRDACPGFVMGKYFDYWYGKCHGWNNGCKNMGLGDGDCDKNSDCRGDLVCGVNNCRSEFGHTGNLWDSTDGCCTDNKSRKAIIPVITGPTCQCLGGEKKEWGSYCRKEEWDSDGIWCYLKDGNAAHTCPGAVRSSVSTANVYWSKSPCGKEIAASPRRRRRRRKGF